MAAINSRAELVVELSELHRLQLQSMADATYVGWTHEELIAQQKRSDRIAVLQLELDALDGTSE